GSPSAAGGHGTVRTPSKRSRPESVASQRYPSVVCAIESIFPRVNPSRILQVVCAYWLTSSEGSRPKALLDERSTTVANPTPSAVLRGVRAAARVFREPTEAPPPRAAELWRMDSSSGA